MEGLVIYEKTLGFYSKFDGDHQNILTRGMTSVLYLVTSVYLLCRTQDAEGAGVELMTNYEAVEVIQARNVCLNQAGRSGSNKMYLDLDVFAIRIQNQENPMRNFYRI